tara:strand:- start:685 stop:1308 length:624 start_codon:yes stop_codon:yes gene_type:complete
MIIRIPNWSEFQHFKDRDPIWIKLYRRLLHKREWRQLSHGAAKFLIDLWLISSRYQGDITAKQGDLYDELAWEVRASVQDVELWVQELVAQEFITVISDRYQDDITKKRREEKSQRREEQTTTSETVPDAAFRGLYGWRGSEGTDPVLLRAFADEADRDRCLMIAIKRLEAEGKDPRQNQRVFRRVLETVIEQQRAGEDDFSHWEDA